MYPYNNYNRFSARLALVAATVFALPGFPPVAAELVVGLSILSASSILPALSITGDCSCFAWVCNGVGFVPEPLPEPVIVVVVAVAEVGGRMVVVGTEVEEDEDESLLVVELEGVSLNGAGMV